MATDYLDRSDELLEKIGKLEPKLTPNEGKVVDVLIDNLALFPPEFFAENTVEDLNEHLGGEGDMAVTSRVKEYMTVFQEWDLIEESLVQLYDERAEGDDLSKIKKVLNGEQTEPEIEMPVKGSEEDIIACGSELEMTPPDMFDDYDHFRKYLPTVWPNHPPIGPQLFEKIKKARA